ncbi:hypothetical protein MF672_032750 [Actinomadura sp. ATCC 31491]|uniref:CBM-cenC domain-containing protein n=1 Tax=Actinomadura luzonensis TaxID=2805427 RepID=A0ABT0G1N2_9ACTN|nr:hypothetical protein [Actinomadura luzonensis]MCK2218529.1 hypothetical protein [Actinomadura luzonensis]
MHIPLTVGRVLRATAAAALLAALLAAPFTPATAADLRLLNDGFDDGLTGWSGSHTPGGVDPVLWNGRTTARVTDADPAAAYGRESMPGLPAVPGTRYTLNAQVWAESGTAYLYLRFRDAAGRLLAGGANAPATGRRWNRVTTSGVAPAGAATVSALIYSGVADVGTAYWDEVLITKDVTDLGVQIESSAPNATTFAGGSAYALYTGTANVNPQLAVIDLATAKVTRKITIPDSAATPTVGGWAAATATDGSVYLGTYPNSKLYRYVPGQSAVTDLGRAEGGYSFIWDLEPGAGGVVYGGTYDQGRYFRYDGAFTTLGAVPVVPGAQNVRSLAHDPAADATYLGTGTHAGLVRYDNATGRVDDLLPPAYAHDSMVGGLTWTGGRLFAWIDRTLLVLRVVRAADGSYSATTDATFTDVDLHHSPARDGKVWFVKEGLLHSYDVAARTAQATGVRPGLDVTGYTWSGGTLVGLGAAVDGTRIFSYDPASGDWSNRPVTGAPVLPAAINALGAGPDGRVYTGGYLTGGTGVHDPLRGDGDDDRPDTPTLSGLSQTDSVLAHDGRLYLGVYPSARLYGYDPGGAWPPALLYTGGAAGDKADDCEPGHGPPPQDRPYALAGGPDGAVYLGTVPKYGKRSGALTVWKAGTAGRTLCVVPDQSVVSLAWAGGRLFGGTSTRGALGVDPVYAPGASATLFSFDPATGAVRLHPLPLTEPKAVTALKEVGGELWGLAGGSLFTLDPAQPGTITVKRLFPDPDYAARPSLAWRDGVLLTVPQDPGHVYGTLGEQIFRIDRATRTATVLLTVKGMEGLTADGFGNLYYKINERLYRLARP